MKERGRTENCGGQTKERQVEKTRGRDECVSERKRKVQETSWRNMYNSLCKISIILYNSLCTMISLSLLMIVMLLLLEFLLLPFQQQISNSLFQQSSVFTRVFPASDSISSHFLILSPRVAFLETCFPCVYVMTVPAAASWFMLPLAISSCSSSPSPRTLRLRLSSAIRPPRIPGN